MKLRSNAKRRVKPDGKSRENMSKASKVDKTYVKLSDENTEDSSISDDEDVVKRPDKQLRSCAVSIRKLSSKPAISGNKSNKAEADCESSPSKRLRSDFPCPLSPLTLNSNPLLTSASSPDHDSDPFSKLFQDPKEGPGHTEEHNESPFSSRWFYKSPSPLNIFKFRSLPRVISPEPEEKAFNPVGITKKYGGSVSKKRKKRAKTAVSNAAVSKIQTSSFSKKSLLDGLGTDCLKSNPDLDESGLNTTGKRALSTTKRKFFKSSSNEKQDRKITTTLFDYRKVPAASLLHEPTKCKDSEAKKHTNNQNSGRKAFVQPNTPTSCRKGRCSNENRELLGTGKCDSPTEAESISEMSINTKSFDISERTNDEVDGSQSEQSTVCDFMSLFSSPSRIAKNEPTSTSGSELTSPSPGEKTPRKQTGLNESTASGTKWPIQYSSSKKSTSSVSSGTKSSSFRRNRTLERKDLDQMVLDAGQKVMGATTCDQCEMLYDVDSEQDKREHFRFHNRTLSKLKFNGWKKERVIRHYIDGRVIVILPEDPDYAHKKFAEVKSVMDSNLGFSNCTNSNHPALQVYFYISETEKSVIGCLVAEPITKAYPVVAGSAPFSCVADPVRCVCGVNRIWTSAAHRRKHVASRMMNCMRSAFCYGALLSLEQIAFSDPTPDGRRFAAVYTNREDFFVYNT